MKTHLKNFTKLSRTLFGALLIGASLLGGCAILQPADVSPPALYSFDNAQPTLRSTQASGKDAPTLVLSPPHAAAGFDSQQMIYLRQPHQLEYFRLSQWVNAPAVMLSPLVAAALEAGGTFGAVLQSPTSVSGDFRLDLEVLRLQQEFLTTPSRVHFTLRAHLINVATRQVIGAREFDVIVPAKSDDPYGGVVAANQAVRSVLVELAEFCSGVVAGLPKSRP